MITNSFSTIINTKVNYIQPYPDKKIYIYQTIIETIKKGKKTIEKSEGTCTDIIEDDLPSSSHYIVAKKELLELAQQEGFSDKFWKHLNKVSEKPYTNFLKDNYDLILRVDPGSHMLFDLSDEPFPVMIRIGTHGITNSQYDLQKALKILKAREDIIIILERFGGKQEIQRIPYYNATATSNECIEFTWSPSLEDYRKIWNESKRLKNKYFSSFEVEKIIFELDLLGLRAAAHFDEFHQRRESEVDNSEDSDDY